MAEETGKSRSSAILVIGGGIAGITAAVEAAETGSEVFLVEKGPSLGGRVAQMHKYFPKLCPPSCGLEINYQRIRKNHPMIRVFTGAEVESISGGPGAFEISVKLHPRYVNEKCTACGKCVEACPVERPNAFNFGMNTTKAVYLPHEMAFPMRYAIDGEVCRKKECAKCVEACPYGAIDLDMAPKSLPLRAGAVVAAIGWVPYDAKRMETLGFGRFANVITNVMMERLAAPNGPTGGKIVRPSDGQAAKRVVFVQCAGSRDENHLPYCSSVCCLASLKQATYVREQTPDSQVRIFYIDLRAPGSFEDFLARVEADPGVALTKGKVAQIEEEPATKDLTVVAEDILGGGRIREKADLVVLAAGMVPAALGNGAAPNLKCDPYGFAQPAAQPPGLVAAGVARQPSDVASAIQDATGAALEAMIFARQGGDSSS